MDDTIGRIEGVLFDFDGVIVDSMPHHVEAWQMAHLEMFNEPIADEIYRKLAGRASKTISEILTKRMDQPLLAQDLAKLKSKKMLDNIQNLPLLPGVIECFRYLKKIGLPFGIVSNSSRPYLIECTSFHKLEVEVLLGLEDFKRPKPNPDPYILGAKKLGLPFNKFKNVLVFEDSTHGLEAASMAGMVPIGVQTFHNNETLRNHGAIATVEHLEGAMRKEMFTRPLLDEK